MANVAEIFDIFVGLLLAVAALAVLARKLELSYPIFFVLGGLALSCIPGLPKVRLNPELVFLFFLPPLLYPAALFTSWRDFKTNIRPILSLAIGLVLYTTVIVAYLAHYFLKLPLSAGFVLGAIVSPPDAVAATAITGRLKVPHKIVAILEGESLVNDATALVAYRFAVMAVLSGAFSLAHAAEQFVFVSVGGILAGLAVGGLAKAFHKRVDDAPIEITVSLLTPYVAYLVSEQLHVSGVLAVVTAGLYLGWHLPELTSFKTRLQGSPVWEMVGFILNGFVFILIGLQLPESFRGAASHEMSLSHLIYDAVFISVAVILIRVVWVFPAMYAQHFFRGRKRHQHETYPSGRHVAIIAWTGMRGVVSLAAALAVPLAMSDAPDALGFPGRDKIVFLTFAVILATLVAQGLSLPAIIRWLGVKDDGEMEKEEHEARLQANRTALARVEEVAARGSAKADALQRLRSEYEEHIRLLEGEPEAAGQPLRLYSSEFERLSLEALQVERRTVLRLRNQSVIGDEVMRRIERDIDLAEARIRDHS